MAIDAPIMGATVRAPLVPAPPEAITRILSRFDRDQLSSFITVAIDLLDVADGDTDVEANGDELDGTAAEDDFYPHSNWQGEPGCPVSDPDCCAARDDSGTDHQATRKLGFDGAYAILDEDAEDGDSDHCLAGDDGCAPFYRLGVMHWGSDWEDQGI